MREELLRVTAAEVLEEFQQLDLRGEVGLCAHNVQIYRFLEQPQDSL